MANKKFESYLYLIPLILFIGSFFVWSLNFVIHDFANYYFGGSLILSGQFSTDVYDALKFNQILAHENIDGRNIQDINREYKFNPLPVSDRRVPRPLCVFPCKWSAKRTAERQPKFHKTRVLSSMPELPYTLLVGCHQTKGRK